MYIKLKKSLPPIHIPIPTPTPAHHMEHKIVVEPLFQFVGMVLFGPSWALIWCVSESIEATGNLWRRRLFHECENVFMVRRTMPSSHNDPKKIFRNFTICLTGVTVELLKLHDSVNCLGN